MKLYLDPNSRDDTFSSVVESSSDLISAIESLGEKKLTPFERAGLVLTMQQIKNGNALTPALESNDTLLSNYFETLAVESLKDNITNAWKKFLAFVKNIVKRFTTFLSGVVTKIRKKFKRKPGDKNNHFEREEGEDNTDENNNSFKPPKSYRLSKCYIDMGSEANFETLVKRLEFSKKLIRSAEVLVAQHGGMAAVFFIAAEKYTEQSQWDDFVKQRSQGVLDLLINDLGAEVKGDRAVVEISDTTEVEMPLKDLFSFPRLVIDTEDKVDLIISGNAKKQSALLQELSFSLVKNIETALKEWQKTLTERDYDQLANTSDQILKNRLMTLSKLFVSRTLFIKSVIDLVFATQEIADGIQADLEAVTQ